MSHAPRNGRDPCMCSVCQEFSIQRDRVQRLQPGRNVGAIGSIHFGSIPLQSRHVCLSPRLRPAVSMVKVMSKDVNVLMTVESAQIWRCDARNRLKLT